MSEDNGLAGAIVEVKSLAQDAACIRTVKVETVKQEPQHVYFIADKDGRFERREAETGPRQYKAFSMPDVIRGVLYFAGVPRALPDALPGEGGDSLDVDAPIADVPIFVWCGRGRVKAVFREDKDRRDSITFDLAPSAPFGIIKRLAADDTWYSQKDIISLLRVHLNARTSPENLVTRLRCLKFGSDIGGEMKVTNGHDTYGRKVASQVLGMDDNQPLPEDIELYVPVYDDLFVENQRTPVYFKIECAFEVDVPQQRFRIKPKAGEVARAQAEADWGLHQQLLNGLGAVPGVSVFVGAGD